MEDKITLFSYNLSDDQKDKLIKEANYIYGDASREWSAFHRDTYPRFASLARKALSHYGGDNYDPHSFELYLEFIVRVHIHNFVQFKIYYRQKSYDWEFIDHFLKRSIGLLLEVDIPYDLARLEQGYRLEDGVVFMPESDSIN